MKSFGKKALDILRGIAPLAASAVGGPFAGAAMSIIAKTVGVDEDKVEQLLELKKAEMELDRWREEAGIRKEELAVQDRQSARQLAMEKGLFAQIVLSVGYTIGYFSIMFLFVFGVARVDPEELGMVNTLIGALGAAQLQILNFFFGSSKGSKDKQDALIKAAGAN
jgi:hypothetical protein